MTVKTIQTNKGIVEIHSTKETVTYTFGNCHYTRKAWEDTNGCFWVKQYGQFNMIERTWYGSWVMSYNMPFGIEVK